MVSVLILEDYVRLKQPKTKLLREVCKDSFPPINSPILCLCSLKQCRIGPSEIYKAGLSLENQSGKRNLRAESINVKKDVRVQKKDPADLSYRNFKKKRMWPHAYQIVTPNLAFSMGDLNVHLTHNVNIGFIQYIPQQKAWIVLYNTWQFINAQWFTEFQCWDLTQIWCGFRDDQLFPTLCQNERFYST